MSNESQRGESLRKRIGLGFLAVAVAVVAVVMAIIAFQLDGASGSEGARNRNASLMESSAKSTLDDKLALMTEGMIRDKDLMADVGDVEVGDSEGVVDLEADALEQLEAELGIIRDMRASFVHGDKPAQFQQYIVLHDTEGSGSAQSVIDWWDSSGRGIAAHFVINKDGTIVQCVELDKIAHHAGYGDTGHNAYFGVSDESRDDKIGTTPIGGWAADYGMNSCSIGIELVHVGGEGDYPEAQLIALDKLIAYIDAYYGFESQIIDHKDWRTGNSDTSPEFSGYLQNYKVSRRH